MRSRADHEQYETARRLLNKDKPWEAYAIYNRLAREGDPHAQVFVGWMCYVGHGCPKDEKLGLDWFGKAAALGSAAGAFYCGRHAASQGNYAEALRLFYEAAAKEYTPALLWLGISHIRGYGVPINEVKGIRYLKRAAEAGNFLARRELAVMMIRGRLGVASIPVGLLLFPYYVFAALIDGVRKGYSENFIG